MFYGCGLRRGELAGLDVENLDLDDCSILVQGSGGNSGPSTSPRTGAGTCGGGSIVAATNRPLFCPVRQTGEIAMTRMRGESISYILRRLQEEAGIEAFSPHDLRRSNITHLLDAGVDVFTVQKLAGHADATTTARYDRRGESAKRQAVKRLELPVAA